MDEALQKVCELFESWYSAMVRYAWRATGSVELAEEVVQEAFLEFCRAARAGARIANPKAWILCVIRHQVSKRLSQEKDSGIVIGSLDDPRFPHPDCLGQVDAAAALDLELDDVTRLFLVLSRREEEVVLLRIEGLKYREIASHLGIAPKTVGTLLGRALRKLRAAAQEDRSRRVKAGKVGNDIPEPL